MTLSQINDSLDDLAEARDALEMIWMAHRNAGDSEARAIARTAHNAIDHMEAAIDRLRAHGDTLREAAR